MQYLIDYIQKYGDAYLIEKPLNEIDLLIFSQLIYNDFKGILSDGEMLLKDAAVKFYEKFTNEQLEGLLDVANRAARLLSLCAGTKRFGSVKVKNFIDNINDAIDKQICAANFVLQDGTTVVTFRGTDASVAGFKESAMLAYMFPVPAQIEALHYFQETAMLSKGDVYACGHSKGGNLAVFAAVNCSNSLKRKIDGIYAYDAPGFPEWFFERYDYRQIRDKIQLYNPQSSLVGRALHMEREPHIVRSDAKISRQHSVATWVIEDDAFATVERYDEESDKLAAYLNDLVVQVGEEDLDAFYNALEETAEKLGVYNFYDLKNVDKNLMFIILDSVQSLNPEQKERFIALVKKVIADAAKDYVSGAATKAKGAIQNVTQNVTKRMPFKMKKKHKDGTTDSAPSPLTEE